MPAAASRSLDTRLRAEVRFVGSVLGEVLREQEGERLFALVEEARGLAIALRRGYQARDERRLRLLLADLPLDDLELLTRAFTLFFQLVNVCEQRHMARSQRRDASDGLYALMRRLHARGLTPEAVETALVALRTTVVLTAHPTEATRWTVHEILLRVGDALERRSADPAMAHEPWRATSPRSGRPSLCATGGRPRSTRCCRRSTPSIRCSWRPCRPCTAGWGRPSRRPSGACRARRHARSASAPGSAGIATATRT